LGCSENEVVPPKVNRVWGADYMLMDSNSFMGGMGEGQYTQVIGLYMNVWNVVEYGLFTGCY
jgi:hypothetical protein